MEMLSIFKAVLEADLAPIVICDMDDIIIYMNPSACKRYQNRGGAELVGRSLLDCHNERSRKLIAEVKEWFAASPQHNLVYTFENVKENKDVYMVALRDDSGKLIGYYEKHEFRTHETMKLYDMGE